MEMENQKQNFDIFEIIKNQYKLAQFFFEQNKTIIEFAEENFYCWDVEKTLWLKTKKDRIINKISDYFTKYLDNLKASITTGDKLRVLGDALNRVGNDKFTLGICRYCPVLFLNDDFEVGYFSFPVLRIKIKPEPGLLVCFPSSRWFTHMVEPVTSGNRYSLVTWMRVKGFKTKEEVDKEIADKYGIEVY